MKIGETKIKLNCKVDSYECKRCLRKLPNVKWKTKSNGWTTSLSSGTVNKYCSYMNAYNDKESISSRQSYQDKCKNSIYSRLNNYYKIKFKVHNEN